MVWVRPSTGWKSRPFSRRALRASAIFAREPTGKPLRDAHSLPPPWREAAAHEPGTHHVALGRVPAGRQRVAGEQCQRRPALLGEALARPHHPVRRDCVHVSDPRRSAKEDPGAVAQMVEVCKERVVMRRDHRVARCSRQGGPRPVTRCPGQDRQRRPLEHDRTQPEAGDADPTHHRACRGTRPPGRGPDPGQLSLRHPGDHRIARGGRNSPAYQDGAQRR